MPCLKKLKNEILIVCLMSFLLLLSFLPSFLPKGYAYEEDIFYSSIISGDIMHYQNGVYPPTFETKHIDGSSNIVLGQNKVTSFYYIYRGFLDFLTMDLPDDAIIVSATLSLGVAVDLSVTDFNIKVYSGKNQWDSQASCDWDDANVYEGILINTNFIILNQYIDMNININSISLNGRTQFRIISSREGTAPSGSEFTLFYRWDGGTYRPKLEITYYTPETPPPPEVSFTSGVYTLYPNFMLKPNNLHTYQVSRNIIINSWTFPNRNLQLIKNGQQYLMNTTASDNVTTTIEYWFESIKSIPTLKFTPVAENLSSLSFTVYTRNYGYPSDVRGESAWSFNNSTNLLTVSMPSASVVVIEWGSEQIIPFVWGFEHLDLLFGVAGIIMCIVSPLAGVKAVSERDFGKALIWLLVLLPIGFSLFLNWVIA